MTRPGLLKYTYLFQTMAVIFFWVVVASLSAAASEPNLSLIDTQDIRNRLTQEEKEWLRQHPTIRVAGPKAFPPFHYYETDGTLKGMASDYLRLIFDVLAIKADIQSDLTWPDVLDRAKEQKLDLISSIAKTAERESYLKFTERYLSFPLVIIAKTDSSFISGLEDLHGKKVAFVKGAAAYEWVRHEGIAMIPYFVKTPLDALKAVSLGQADVHIENLAAATYLIQQHGLANLKVAAPAFNENYNLYIAARKDWPELVSIINKILSAITPQQHSMIRNHWLTIEYEHGIRKKEMVTWLLGIGTLAVIIFLMILLWNRRLSREIRERQEAEQELVENEYRFRELFNNMHSCVAVYSSPDSGETFVFTDMNKAGLDSTQARKEEILGREVREVFSGVESLGLFEVFQRVWQTGRAEHHPAAQYSDERISIWVENYVCKLPSGELVAIYEDLTASKKAEEDRVKLEQQLRQTQKLESIGNLAGGIAHDFNNILSSIIGYTELALEDVEKGSVLQDNLQEVFRAGKRARDLVKQILTFARQSDEEQKPIQVDTIAGEVLRLIRSTIPTTIEIRQRLESNSLIMGNPTQVHQLFMNICTNAAQAMEDTGGILEVVLVDVGPNEKSRRMPPDLAPGNYVNITFSDTGVGIAPGIIDSIFEPYFTVRGDNEGTGMGLAVVHGIVVAHGGKITVSSNPGHGTVFSIFLPITKKRSTYQPAEKEELPSGNERILLIDDELPIAHMSRQILERLGYRITVCTGSVEALTRFRAEPNSFDLVITDMTMPEMTGDILAAELMKVRPDLPIILCTGYSRRMSDKRASEIGIKAFVHKPIVREDLAKIVRTILDNANGPVHG